MSNAFYTYINLDPAQQSDYFQACLLLMNDEIRESMHNLNLSNDVFLQLYCDEHTRKFNEQFKC